MAMIVEASFSWPRSMLGSTCIGIDTGPSTIMMSRFVYVWHMSRIRNQ